MSEIDEITNGKTAEELEREIAFQIQQGENPGGNIIGEIQYRIEQLRKKSYLYIIKTIQYENFEPDLLQSNRRR